MTKENLENICYAFCVYTNPNTQTQYLLFKGAGFVEGNKINILHKYDYLTTAYGYKKMRNYNDMVLKFGEKPCFLVDIDCNIVSDKKYQNQDKIATEFKIKLSRLAKKAFSEKDVVGTKRIIKMANKK